MKSSYSTTLFLALSLSVPMPGQQTTSLASEKLQHALRLADLYNWADATSDFAEAEKLFLTAGDQRNALYARLGVIRAESEQHELPETSAQLAAELTSNTLLQSDKNLRMFCLIVKGDIDGEINAAAMREDWQEVAALARDLGNEKWQYRSLAQLGIAAFYDGDLQTARKNVGAALEEATKRGDAGAQIRYMTTLGVGLVESKLYGQALQYLDGASRIAQATPDAGYPFTTSEQRIVALIGLGQLDAAQRTDDEVLARARQHNRVLHEAAAMNLAATIARARNDTKGAIAILERSLNISGTQGVTRPIADAQWQLSQLYRETGDLNGAARFATLAAASTQAIGDMWTVPSRLKALAEVEISQGKYVEAGDAYQRASAFVDSLIGNYTTVLEKTAAITASSDVYTGYFALAAQHFHNLPEAYGIVEQVRGRVLADLLMAGSTRSVQAANAERTIARLRIKLMSPAPARDVQRIRDQIFQAEQTRWINPDISILKARVRDTVELPRLQQSLSPSVVILEYVVADPASYCLVVTRSTSRIVELAGKQRLDVLVESYLKTVKAKQPAEREGRMLYDALLAPVSEAKQKPDLVIVPDGRLHLTPFGALVDKDGKYVLEAHSVTYAPSATGYFYLSALAKRPRSLSHTLLAVGGVPYSGGELQQVAATRGFDPDHLSDLPASADEVQAAELAVHDASNTLLVGPAATESAFKNADLAHYRYIHLAVHGFASDVDPDRSALILRSDTARGEDGFLQASEIVQMRLNADLVVLSACDSALGPIQGEEGIAALSRAFLLAGARSVVSTLWSVDDTFSSFLMKQFYGHLAADVEPATALAEAQRDMLRRYGRVAVPYYWAAFQIEGAPGHSTTAKSPR
jgi:CHAT domain-containing protein